MDAIEKALLDYGIAFNRIPCPANLALPPTDANYGTEAANQGTCTGGTAAASFAAASGTVEGAVPTRALRLPDDYMYDAWGRRLAVDPSGNFWVVDMTNSVIDEFNSSGTYLRRIGTSGTGNGQFQLSAFGIAIGNR